jgi:hypothetical protein
MTNDELLKEIASLSAEAKRQIERFVAILKKKDQETLAHSTDVPLACEDFIGLWADREDMSDSTAWVRSLRQSDWSRDLDGSRYR